MKTLENEARSRLLHRQARLLEAKRANRPVDARELDDITAALRRMDQGRYGECEVCGSAIGRQRLTALPETALCIACAERDFARFAL